MPIKDPARRFAGPDPADVTGGSAIIAPSEPIPGYRVPGDQGYRQPEAQSIYTRAHWIDHIEYNKGNTLSGLVWGSTGFPIYTILIDNQTGQWLQVHGARMRFIPPWFFGIVMAANGNSKLEVDVAAPLGVIQASITSADLYYTVSVTEEKIPPSPGTVFQG